MDDTTEAGMRCVCGHFALSHIQPDNERCSECACVEFTPPPRPRTAEEILALPIFGWGITERVIDGTLYRVRTMPAVMCVFSEPSDIMSVTDHEGTWMLGRYADGRWFRRQIL